MADSKQTTLFDIPKDSTGVSVRKEGERYHVTLRGEEIVIHEWSFLMISRANGKFIVDTEGKRMIMDDAEFDAFHFGLANADREARNV